MNFLTDFRKLAAWLIPALRRLPNFKSWIRALATEINYVNAEFVAFAQLMTLQMSYNSQVMVLERALNNTFSPNTGGITITDGPLKVKRIYCYYPEEGQPSLGFVYYPEEGHPSFGYVYYPEEVTGAIDFTVNVPAALGLDLNQVQAIINKYKLLSKTNNIITY